MPSTALLGILFLTGGALIWISLRILLQPPRLAEGLFLRSSSASSEESKICLSDGGKTLRADPAAREWFASIHPLSLDSLARAAQPAEDLLRLAHAEGSAVVRIADALYFGTSIPKKHGMEIHLRRMLPSAPPPPAFSTRFDVPLAALSDLAIADAVQNLLQSLLPLTPADWAMLTVWDPERRLLVRQGSLAARSLNPACALPAEEISIDSDLTGAVARNRRPLRNNRLRRTDSQGFSAYLGFPLLASGILLGTIDFFSESEDAFPDILTTSLQPHIELASFAVRNAQFYEEQSRRAADAAVLAEISASAGDLADSDKFFGELAGRLARAAESDVAGFFLLDESSQTLLLQTPCFGIENDKAQSLQIPLAANSPALAYWLGARPVSASGSAVLRLARELGWEADDKWRHGSSLCLLPLAEGESSPGWLLLAATKPGAFDGRRIRRMQSLAWQAGRLVAGFLEVAESRKRSRLSESLWQLSTISSECPSEVECLRRTLIRVASTLEADGAALLLLEEGQHQLRLSVETATGFSEEESRALSPYSTTDAFFHQTVTSSQRPLPSHGSMPPSAGRLPNPYRRWAEQLRASALIAAPLSLGMQPAGEIIVIRRRGVFSPADSSFLEGAAGYINAALERGRFTSVTDATLQRRVRQLTALTRISHELNAMIDLPNLLQLIHGEMLRVTRADGGRIAIVDPENPGSAVRPILLVGDPLPNDVLSTAEAAVLATGTSRRISASDFAGMVAGLPVDRSAMIYPVLYQQKAVGLILLYSADEQTFDEDSQEFAQTITLQIAIAFGNAQRHEEQSQTSATLRHRMRLLHAVHTCAGLAFSGMSLAQQMQSVAEGIHNALGFNPVAVGLLRGGSLEWSAACGLSAEDWEHARQERLPLSLLSEGTPDAAIRLFSHENRPGEHDILAASLGIEAKGQSMVCALLRSTDRKPIGLLVGASALPTPPTAEAGEALETFAAQASLLWLLAAGYSSPAAPAAVREEMPPAFPELERRLARLLTFRQVTESLADLPNVQTLFETFARNLLESFSLDSVLIVEEGSSGPRLRCLAGSAIAGAPVDMMLGLNNPILAVLQRRIPILTLALEEDPAWKNSPLMHALQARSFVCFPIRTHRSAPAAALLVSCRVETPFAAGDADLFRLLGEQTATLVENTQLLEETRRRLREGNVLLEFSRQVAALDLPSIAQALADGVRDALPEAEGVMVALWEEEHAVLEVRSAAGYSNPNRIRTIACRAGEGPLGRAFVAGSPVRWAALDLASTYNLRPENLEAYRSGAGGMVPLSSLAAPLQVGDAKLGAVLLENFSDAEAFTANAEEVAVSLSNQAALALEKARLFQEMMDRTRELDERVSHLALLNRLSSTAISTSSETALLQAACRELANAFDVPQAAAALLDPDQASALVVVEYLYPGRPSGVGTRIPVGGVEPIQAVLQTRAPMQVEHAPSDPRLELLRPWLTARQATSVLFIPLIVAGNAAGFFLVESPEPHPFSLADLSLAQTVAAQLGQALENVRLHLSARSLTTDLEQRVVERTTALEREHRRAEILLRICTELVVSLDLELVLHRALELVNEAIGADQAAIVLNDPDTLQLVFRAALVRDGAPPTGGRSLPFHVGEGLAGWVIEQRQSVILPDISADPRWVHLYPGDPPHYRSALAVPLMVGADALGALLLLSRDPSVFNSEQLSLVSAAANQVASTINNAELYRLIRDQADRLGGLVRAQQVETRKSRAMLEAIADGVMVTDSDHYIVLFNDAAERILGLTRPNVQGRPAADYIGLFGKAGRAWLESLHRWRAFPAEVPAGEYLAERIILENGNVISVHLAPISSDEEYEGAVAIFRDITKEVEVDRLKSEFVATVSHELRTPMTSIKGYVEILLMGAAGGLTNRQRDFLDIVKENTDRLERLGDDLLNISRIEAGRIHLVNDPVEVLPMMEETATALRERCRRSGKSLEIRVEVEEGIGSFLADPPRVKEILDNLAENAFLYTPEGGSVILRAHKAEDGVQFDVTDTGVGIPPAEQARVFERFFRGTDPLVMAAAGTGLGLAITRHLVELHGGRIWMESEGVPGRGSTFHVVLPRDGVQSS